MQTQLTKNQKGEIEFRKKLYFQQVEGRPVLEDEFDAPGIKKILEGRMKRTFDQMNTLGQKGVGLSPYVEIGAERCQRSLVMENDLGADGAAVDISYDLLRSCNHYAEIFSRPKSPVRICCDANNLPFITSSIPFVFCYETLHHFPEPTPITEEIYRVLLPGGCFFFDEEPYQQVLHVNLYKGRKIYSGDSLNRSMTRRVLDKFFCTQSCNEAEHGIIENHNISVRSWKRALTQFEEKDIDLNATSRYRILRSKLFNPASYMRHFVAYLLGGTVSGVAKKRGNPIRRSRSIYDALICPSCRQTGSEVRVHQRDSSFLCAKCSKLYPVINEVLFLFTYDKFEELYPEIFNLCQKQ
jgi:SAM-dependent methyltransferase